MWVTIPYYGGKNWSFNRNYRIIIVCGISQGIAWRPLRHPCQFHQRHYVCVRLIRFGGIPQEKGLISKPAKPAWHHDQQCLTDLPSTGGFNNTSSVFLNGDWVWAPCATSPILLASAATIAACTAFLQVWRYPLRLAVCFFSSLLQQLLFVAARSCSKHA